MYYKNTRKHFHVPLAVVLVLSLLVWTTGFPMLLPYAHAALATSVKDTLTDSDVSANSNHTILFTAPGAIALGETITVTFPAGFSLTGVVEDDVDIADDGVEHTTAADCTGTEKAGVAISGQVLTITICAGDSGNMAATS